jgi:NAD(P)-dependent dehydrogenase (short-subunit alcohol dehydrogenase family)
MGRLSGKVGIITGGASGFGEATARLFAREGAKVVIADYLVHKGGEEHATAICEDIRKGGGEVIFIRVDVSQPADAQKMVETAVKTYGRLNVLFNNAGIQYPLGIDLADYPIEEGNRIIDVNFKGVWYGMRYAIPVMIKAGGGSIISTSSICAFNACSGSPIYSATKGAVSALSITVANEYARCGIRSNTICPGPARSPLHADFLKTKAGQDVFNTIQQEIPLGRTCEPEDIAHAALFLASDESAFITGIDLMVDGGWRSRGLRSG